MSKKILYISYDGMTDPLGQSQVIPYLQGLARKGYDITLLSFEKKDKLEKMSAVIEPILLAAGIKWQPELFSRRPPLLAKIWDVWRMKKIAHRLHQTERFDLVHCRSYVAAEAGLQLTRRYKLPFLFDMRGFWVDERVDNGQWNLKNPLYQFFFKRYKKKELAYFKESAHIISLTWKGKEELVNAYGVGPEKITVIPCCVDLDHFNYETISPADISKKKQDLDIKKEDKILSYLGSLGGWYLQQEMMDFFVTMKKEYPSLKFLFITPDPAEKILAAASSSGAVAADIIVQAASRKEVPLYLALSDWSIFFIKDAYSKKASSPTKQGEIMAMGVPLICNDIGDTGRIISTSGAGRVINALSTEKYERVIAEAEALRQINPEHIRKAAFEYYDLQIGIASYYEVYKKLAG